MTKLTWDGIGDRLFETGVDHGVLYIPDAFGVYNEAHPWNGLTSVTEKPTGAEASPQYADNIKYLNLISAEDYEATIEAFTYPDAWAQCDGSAEPEPGITIGQQTRKSFGFGYRTKVGNDLVGQDYGYKLHLVYGALAAPSEKAYNTVNDSPEATPFSWDVTTTPVEVPGFKPSATITIDSTKVDADALAALEDALYGTESTEGRLPTPAEVFAFFTGSGPTQVVATAPTYNGTTGVITIPTVTGVIYKINGQTRPAGAQPAITVDSIVKAVPTAGYVLAPNTDDDWAFEAP